MGASTDGRRATHEPNPINLLSVPAVVPKSLSGRRALDKINHLSQKLILAKQKRV